MRFDDISQAVLCDNCHCYAKKRLVGMTKIVRLNLCAYCIERLRLAINALSPEDSNG